MTCNADKKKCEMSNVEHNQDADPTTDATEGCTDEKCKNECLAYANIIPESCNQVQCDSSGQGCNMDAMKYSESSGAEKTDGSCETNQDCVTQCKDQAAQDSSFSSESCDSVTCTANGLTAEEAEKKLTEYGITDINAGDLQSMRDAKDFEECLKNEFSEDECVVKIYSKSEDLVYDRAGELMDTAEIVEEKKQKAYEKMIEADMSRKKTEKEKKKKQEQEQFNSLFSDFQTLTQKGASSAGTESESITAVAGAGEGAGTGAATIAEAKSEVAVDASTKLKSFKETLQNDGMLCEKESCSELENDLKFKKMMDDMASSSTLSSLESCSKTASACDEEAKRQLEVKIGSMTASEFQEKKAQAVLTSLHDDASYLQEIKKAKTESSNSADAKKKVKEVLAEKLSKMGYADESGSVPLRKVNRFYEESQASAIVAAAELVDPSASPKKRKLALKQALESTGAVVTSMTQVLEMQARGAANNLANVLESGSCKEVGKLSAVAKAECETQAKARAEKTMGRPLRKLEFKRLREESAVSAAAKLREQCNSEDKTCQNNLMSKLKTLTGNSRLSPAKAEQFVRKGVQRAAASDMQSCLAESSDSSMCRRNLLKTVAGSLGKSSVKEQEVQDMIRSGGINAILRTISACREAAESAQEKASCRSRKVGPRL